MATVVRAVLHPLVLMWAAILYYALQDIAFSAALLVGALGYALVDLLLRRIGPHLGKIISALMLIAFLALLVADAPFRGSVQRFIEDVLKLTGPRSIVWGLVVTFVYGVRRSGSRPTTI